MKAVVFACVVSVAVVGCSDASSEQRQDPVVAEAAVQVPASQSAAAEPDAYWLEGFGQGNLEYFIDHQGLRLYIACPTADGSYDASSGVSLSHLSNDMTVRSFSIDVNGTTYDAPFRADTRNSENAFLSLLDDLRAGDATVTFEGTTVTFPRSNAAEVLPSFGSGVFPCNLM